METVTTKYPWADRRKVGERWNAYQYTDQKSYKSFLEFYEKTK